MEAEEEEAGMRVTSFDLFCQLTVASGGGFPRFYLTLGWETRWTQGFARPLRFDISDALHF